MTRIRASHRLAPSRRAGWLAAASVALCLAVSACSSGSGAGTSAGSGSAGASGDLPVRISGTSSPAADLQGSELDTPVAKPAGSLTDTSGQPYDLATATAGRLTLLYFGYTHCPDVCPTTMADLAVAMTQVPAQVRSHTTVVFVTSDPARDTPPVIRTWLNAFDTSFVGLTGPIDQIDQMAASVGVSLQAPVTLPDGSISVTHGAQVLAYSPTDNLAHVLYTAGSSSDQYAHDLPLLATGAT